MHRHNAEGVAFAKRQMLPKLASQRFAAFAKMVSNKWLKVAVRSAQKTQDFRRGRMLLPSPRRQFTSKPSEFCSLRPAWGSGASALSWRATTLRLWRLEASRLGAFAA